MQQLSFFTPEEYEKLKIIQDFCEDATTSQIACILNYILLDHTFFAFDPNKNSLTEIENACVNGSCIQLNLEEDEK